jgi:hypothetical protein
MGTSCFHCSFFYSLSPQGEGWGEGSVSGKPLFYLSPHPGLLPEGEGMTAIIESYNFILSVCSNRPGFTALETYEVIMVMLTKQQ